MGKTNPNPVERAKQIANLKVKLDNPVILIKEGHVIQGINPDGVEMVVPMTDGQIARRQQKLEENENPGSHLSDGGIGNRRWW